MYRDSARFTRNQYDLLIIGGGIYGICAAWDATLRGLSVALVERGDFCGATSANPLKIVHGGFRYIQHADVRRMRESIHERRVLMRIAPHLVYPLPFLIPTYGHGMQGKEMLTLALFLYDLFGLDRNRGITDPQKRIPWGRVIPKDECLHLFPTLEKNGLTGAVVFYDGQMYNPPRLTLSYLRSAVNAGAEAVNYLEVTGFLRDRTRVTGIKARDLLTGNELEICGRIVLNASGPWAEQVLRHLGVCLRAPLLLTKDLYLVVDRLLSENYALAVPSRYKDPDAIVSRGRRHFFLIPWRGRTLIGSSHVIYGGPPDEFAVTEKDVQELIDEINEAYPPLALTPEDVSMWNAGLVPFGNYYGKRSRIIDHAKEHGMDGLVSITGVRYTTSRGVATEAVDLVLKKLGRKAPASMTAVTSIYGGAMACFNELVRRMTEERPPGLSREVMRALLHNYGSEYGAVLKYLDEDPTWAETLGTSTIIKAEVIHALREEMAQKLGDVVFRRTDLGTAGHPGEDALRACAALMAAELKWDAARVQQELDEVRMVFPWRSCASS
jgi:glycerol-3-phosphate dehydrogenase